MVSQVNSVAVTVVDVKALLEVTDKVVVVVQSFGSSE